MVQPKIEPILKASIGVLLVSLSVLVIPTMLKTSYVVGQEEVTKEVTKEKVESKENLHIAPPQAQKAIYMSACVAATPSWRNKLAKLIDDTELNSVIIDIKDYSGTVSFKDKEGNTNGGPGCIVKDMKEFVQELHQKNIYVIGRITVFQDPLYTKVHPEYAVKKKSDGTTWKDRKGLAFVDVGAKPYWDHVITLAKDSYELGFDEINFDYIRYPSDGDMKNADYTWSGNYTKSEMLEKFFIYLHEHLKDTGMKTSADLFGLVTVAKDDMGIGQVLEKALPYFDYIDPMVYPSHFGAGSGGIKDPASHPYEIIKYSMGEAVTRTIAASSSPEKLRPWFQDFDLGADYGVEEVRAQIKANTELGLDSWMMWDASNKYTEGAYLAE